MTSTNHEISKFYVKGPNLYFQKAVRLLKNRGKWLWNIYHIREAHLRSFVDIDPLSQLLMVQIFRKKPVKIWCIHTTRAVEIKVVTCQTLLNRLVYAVYNTKSELTHKHQQICTKYFEVYLIFILLVCLLVQSNLSLRPPAFKNHLG